MTLTAWDSRRLQTCEFFHCTLFTCELVCTVVVLVEQSSFRLTCRRNTLSCRGRHVCVKLWPIAEGEQQLEPHEKRCQEQALHKTIHQAWLPLLEVPVSGHDLHKPAEQVRVDGPQPSVAGVGLAEGAGPEPHRQPDADGPRSAGKGVQEEVEESVGHEDEKKCTVKWHVMWLAAWHGRGQHDGGGVGEPDGNGEEDDRDEDKVYQLRAHRGNAYVSVSSAVSKEREVGGGGKERERAGLFSKFLGTNLVPTVRVVRAIERQLLLET